MRAGRRRYDFAAPDSDGIGAYLRSVGRPYEHDLLRTLAPLLLRSSAVVDVGANIGNHAVYFAVVRRVRIHAFEPNPEAREWLRRNADANGAGRIVIHEQALSDEAGRASVISTGDLGLTQTVPDEAGEVEVRRLDDFDFPLKPRIALLKIDVEGAEERVLAGAASTIRRHKPLIAVEARDEKERKRIDVMLGQHRYHRMPFSFAHTPTYIYYPSRLYLPVLMASAAIAKTLRRMDR